MDEEKSGQTGYAYILDKEGTIIAHPKKKRYSRKTCLKTRVPK